MQNFWQSWMVVSIAIPIFYALDCVLDSFFVGKKIYSNATEASLLSGLFTLVIIIFCIPFAGHFKQPDFDILVLGITNGALYFLHIYFYFNALFKLNDVSNLESFLGFNAVLVPLFAFVLLNEQLNQNQYIGIGVSMLGVIILTLSNLKRGLFTRTLGIMSGAIVLLAMTFIIQSEISKYINFYTTFVLFLTGILLCTLFLWLGSNSPDIVTTAKKYFRFFLISKLISLSAIICTLRAIDISPSVTLVAIIETTTPLFVMIISLLLIPVITHNKKEYLLPLSILKEQLIKLPSKLVAFTCLLIGITFSNINTLFW